MTILTRLTRLFKADIHAILDNLEEPELLLQQSIREMQYCLELLEMEANKMEQEVNSISNRLNLLDSSLSKNERELDLCFQSEQTELARKLVKRKLEYQRSQEQLLTARENKKDTWQRLCDELETNRDRYNALKQKADLFSESPVQTMNSCADPVAPWTAEFTQEDLELAYLSEKQRREIS